MMISDGARVPIPNSRAAILREFHVERERQLDKFGPQSWPDGTSENFRLAANGARERCDQAAKDGTLTWLHILTEEWAEAKAEVDPVKLRAELVQVGAVATAWIEDIDSR